MSTSLIYILHSLIFCWLPLTYFPFSYCILQLQLVLSCIFSSLKFSLNSPTLISSMVRIFMNITLNHLSGTLFTSISFHCFFEILSYSSFGAYSSTSWLCLLYCVCLYELNGAATLPKLEGIVLCMVVPYVDCMCLVTLAGWCLAQLGSWGFPWLGFPGGMAWAKVHVDWGVSRALLMEDVLAG